MTSVQFVDQRESFADELQMNYLVVYGDYISTLSQLWSSSVSLSAHVPLLKTQKSTVTVLQP